MKFYILGKGDAVYSLVTEDGEVLATHWCSSEGFAKGDLEANRPDRQKNWREKFGDYKVLFLGDDEITEEELLRRNQKQYEEDNKANKPTTDTKSKSVSNSH